MRVYIFSEVYYDDNKHINQYVFDFLRKKNIDCYFVERITMNIPIGGYLNRIKNKFKNIIYTKNNKKITSYNIDPNIIKTFIFPPLFIFGFINRIILKKNKLILNKDDVIITFVPHKHILNVSGNRAKMVYYCVHDTTQQKYPNKNKIIDFEKNILAKKSLVFCDNKIVIEKLGLDTIDYINSNGIYKKGYSAYLMPPPVPNEFFIKNNNVNTISYDFIYYGSFHKDIDLDVIISILANHKVLIVSNNCPSELYKYNNITIKKSIYSMKELANTIRSAQCILLPYKNSKFMETITPAKILQVKAFSMPVVCTNHYLADKYLLSNNINNPTVPTPISSIFSVENICTFILNKIDELP
ncbi:protein of unknown function [Xenorhabdus poinarii G6]|uniref:Glycosyltransferase n=1 Tax=Xenorhabdus poinarii G6 TaxID=1354304 RepID=A0A068R8F1_9GAMM|nr:hypothetical protein [Xenorhabdus poinarii]CDG23239.1 protein of unknown function [Xenorhabdus poinarii G6]